MFFINKNDQWELDEKAPIFDLQDPFISFLKDEIIFGGVEIRIENNLISYRTIFFKGKNIYDLKKFAEGPEGMKDIRLSQLPSQISEEISSEVSSEIPGLGIFTRPQGKIGGRGRIGFMKIDSLDHFEKLKHEEYYSAKLISDFFLEEEWLGVNAIYQLKNGKLGILGHIACFSNLEKHYYPIVFSFDHKTNSFSKIKIIATRKDLGEGKSKRPDLKYVLFSGGLVRLNDGTAKLYAGAGDAEAYEITMTDPFLEYEI